MSLSLLRGVSLAAHMPHSGRSPAAILGAPLRPPACTEHPLHLDPARPIPSVGMNLGGLGLFVETLSRDDMLGDMRADSICRAAVSSNPKSRPGLVIGSVHSHRSCSSTIRAVGAANLHFMLGKYREVTTADLRVHELTDVQVHGEGDVARHLGQAAPAVQPEALEVHCQQLRRPAWQQASEPACAPSIFRLCHCGMAR